MVSPEYLAGIVDGEGYVGVTVRKKPKARLGLEFTPRVQINMTRAKELLEEITQQYHGTINPLRRKNAPKNWSPILTMLVRHSHVKPLLEDILPYLRIKKAQALLVLEFLTNHCPHGKTNDENLLRQVEIYNKLKTLNVRGTGKPKLLDITSVRPRRKSGFLPILTKEQLHDLYWNKELTPTEIAKKVDRSSCWISFLLKQYDIPRRGKSLSLKLRLQKYPQKRGTHGYYIRSHDLNGTPSQIDV